MQNMEDVKELLLEDHKYFQESFWKNETVGETRVNFFITLVTAVIAALITLLSSFLEKGTNLSDVPSFVFYVILAALAILLFIGIVTLFRLLKRNDVTDGYKKDMDDIRQRFKDYFDTHDVLKNYFPLVAKSKTGDDEKDKRKPGGLSDLIILFNGINTTGFVAVMFREFDLTSIVLWSLFTFIASVSIQLSYIQKRRKKAKQKNSAHKITHTGGVVYSDGKYLITTSRNGVDQVFPKGHIEGREEHKDAAIREVKEECGVIGLPLRPLGTYEFMQKDETVICKYYLMLKVGELAQKENRTNSWLTFDEAMQALKLPEPLELLQLARFHIENFKPHELINPGLFETFVGLKI